ncbi:MAG: toxin-antitoxin system YwqK family antitoxin [Mangrovibacterium sp.]
MLKQIVFTLLMLVVFGFAANAQSPINQTDTFGRKQGLWQKNQASGQLLYSGSFKDDKPVGEWKRYHANGMVKAILVYAEGSGPAGATLFDELGQKVATGFYLEQEKNGHWVYFDKNQRVQEEEYARGIKNGKSKTYYPSGELFVETTYADGLQEGVYRAFFKNGTPYFECRMKDDKRDGICHVFHENGELETEANYVDGLRDGLWKYYSEQGTYQYTLIYDRGILQNKSVLDSLEQIRYNQMDGNRNKIVDPERFMSDPSEYMMQKGIR